MHIFSELQVLSQKKFMRGIKGIEKAKVDLSDVLAKQRYVATFAYS